MYSHIFNVIKFKLFLFILTFTQAAISADDIELYDGKVLDCFFEENHVYYDINSAVKDAQRAFYEFEYYIYIVVNGFAPERPGIENDFELACLKLEQKSLLMGADVSGQCNQKTWSTLNKKAVDYSEAFNKEMLRLYKKNFYEAANKGTPLPAESGDWDEAFEELNAYIWGAPTRYGSGLGWHPTVPPEFTISLVDLELAEDTTNEACEIFLKHGISMSVQFYLDEHKKYDGEWKTTKIASFTCENGKRSELNLKSKGSN